MSLSSYKDLIVWQKSIDLVIEIYSMYVAYVIYKEVHKLSTAKSIVLVLIPILIVVVIIIVSILVSDAMSKAITFSRIWY